jgi:hypothetical protein
MSSIPAKGRTDVKHQEQTNNMFFDMDLLLSIL